MSDCIRINGLENLPLENTLLINYTILCTGTWELAQLLTAYRNVCDTEWTVMYPNFQHPRHTDFPILVTTPGLNATFAWNYGGIQGIAAENFDEAHTYLTQLSIFNYGCYYTGDPGGSTSTGTGEPPVTGLTGTQTGGSGGGGTGPIGGGPGGGGGGVGIPIPSVIPFPPVGGSIPNNQVNLVIPDNQVIYDPVLGGSSGQSGTQPLNPEIPVQSTYNELNPQVYNVVIPQVYPQFPSGVVGGYSTEVVSPYIPSTPSVPYGSVITYGGNIEINGTVSTVNIGAVPGLLSSTTTQNPGVSIENSLSLRQINTSTVIPGSFTNLVIGSDEITIGSPAIVSASYTLPQGVETNATAQLYILTSQDNVYLLLQSATTFINSETSLQLGGSIATNAFNLGQSTLIFIVKNTENQIIGVSSTALILREQPTLPTTHVNLPTSISSVNGSPLQAEPITVTLVNSTSQNLILVPTNTSGSLNAVVIGETEYNLSSNTSSTSSSSAGSITFSGTQAGSSNGPIILNGAALYPDLYSAGLTSTTTSGNVILTVQPKYSESLVTEGNLHISEGFNLAPWTSSESNYNGSTATITIGSPYAVEPLKLIVHGYVSGNIEYPYTLYSSETNLQGQAVFSNVAVSPEQYYSVVLRGDGTYNPSRYIARTFLYD